MSEIDVLQTRNRELEEALAQALSALERTLPPLILLGDYIGNEFAGKVGIEAFDRCAIIGAVRDALERRVLLSEGPY